MQLKSAVIDTKVFSIHFSGCIEAVYAALSVYSGILKSFLVTNCVLLPEHPGRRQVQVPEDCPNSYERGVGCLQSWLREFRQRDPNQVLLRVCAAELGC